MILSECNSFQPVSEWSPTLGIDSSGHVVGYAYDFAGRYTTGTTALTTGTWYHVAMTIANSGSMIVYVNGVAGGNASVRGNNVHKLAERADLEDWRNNPDRQRRIQHIPRWPGRRTPHL